MSLIISWLAPRIVTNPASGVVDRDRRVFGTDNLYVPGAAVFLSGSFANWP